MGFCCILVSMSVLFDVFVMFDFLLVECFGDIEFE